MTVSATPRVIGLISLGCAKNLVDSEVLMKQLAMNGFRLVFEPESLTGVDTLIINTCGFIGDARHESVDTILQYAREKQAGRIRRLFIMGCLAERYREELAKEIPEADGVFGVHQLPDILRTLGGEVRLHHAGERMITTPSHYAYLKIAEGCDRTCSFCAIPLIRGKHRSRPLEEIHAEATWLASQGVKELLIIAQDTTYYGIDLYGRRRLADLLRKLSSVNELRWIRLHYTYPHAFPREVLSVIRDHPNICNYIDLPLQHISDRILRSMKRGMNADRTKRLVETIRHTIPDVAIRTTFITGYPGESDREFEELIRFVREFRFERVGVFPYSREEGTPAHRLKDPVPGHIKELRKTILMDTQEEISLERNSRFIGTEMQVLVDRVEQEFFIGRSEYDSPEVDQEILIRKRDAGIRTGEFVRILITDAGPFELVGEPRG